MGEKNGSALFGRAREFTNTTGTFYADECGRLLRYVSTDRNALGENRRNCFSVTIPEGITELADRIFGGYGIRYFTLPASLMKVSVTAFSGANISEITLPEHADGKMMEQLARALRFGFSWYPRRLVESWPKEYADIYLGKGETWESMRKVTNSCGTFFLDSDSVLMDFLPSEQNMLTASDHRINIEELNIPEGVKAISEGAISRLHIHKTITFPSTLKWMGCPDDRSSRNLFCDCTLPDLVLPCGLEILAPGSFIGCSIRSLTVPGNLHEYLSTHAGRRFKDSSIFEVRVPMEYRKCLIDAYNVSAPCLDIVTGEMFDEELGRLFCVRSESASLGWGNFMDCLIYGILRKN